MVWMWLRWDTRQSINHTENSLIPVPLDVGVLLGLTFTHEVLQMKSLTAFISACGSLGFAASVYVNGKEAVKHFAKPDKASSVKVQIECWTYVKYIWAFLKLRENLINYIFFKK